MWKIGRHGLWRKGKYWGNLIVVMFYCLNFVIVCYNKILVRQQLSLLIAYIINQIGLGQLALFPEFYIKFVDIMISNTQDPTDLLNSSEMVLDLKASSSLHKQFEKQCKIQKISPLRFNPLKATTLTILIAATVFGLVLLVWYKWLRVRLWYSSCTLDEADHLYIQSERGSDDIQPITKSPSKISFHFKKLKYSISSQNVIPTVWDYQSNFKNSRSKTFLKTGLNDTSVQQRLEQYGKNQHQVDFPGFFVYVGNGMLDPFFLVQYSVCILVEIFSMQGYFVFGIVNIVLSFAVISCNYFLTGYQEIKQRTGQTINVRVLRNSKFIQVSSSELVPGDLIDPQGEMLCDCILVRGEAEVSEISLSGSSRNVRKIAAKSTQVLNQENRWIYDGSKILEKRNGVLALVVNTGYATRRGRFLRKILTVPLQTSQTMKSSLKFWLMTFTAAYIIYSCSIYYMTVKNVPAATIGLRFIDFLGWSFPPAFSIYCNLTYTFEIIRLKQKNIRSIVPDKTAEACYIKTLCFDKTGTLTETQLQIYRTYRFVDENNIVDVTDEMSERNNELVRKIFATCHSLENGSGSSKSDDFQQKATGNQIDEKLLDFSGYTMKWDEQTNSIEFKDGQQSLQVLRVNQFDYDLQSMSVLVKDNRNGLHYVFIKGAPEKIIQNSTLNINQYQSFVNLSLRGYLTLGFGYKIIGEGEVPKYLKLSRGQFEQGIIALGLITFQNKLKPDARRTIERITFSGIRPLLLTGDSIYTAIQTAIRAGVIPGTQVLIFEGQRQKHTESSQKLKGKLITYHGHTITDQLFQVQENQDCLNLPYSIAIDGEFIELFPHIKISENVRIFGRMSPGKKSHVIKELKKNIEANHLAQSVTKQIFGEFQPRVGMCGDGANDLMAIREADVGIGMNNSDCISGSTFVINQLMDIDELIRDNKAATINIIEMMLYYNFICFLKIPAAFMMLMDSAYFSDNQTFFINYTSTMIYPVLLSMARPSTRLTRTTPNGNLIAPIHLVRFWGSLIIATAGLIAGYFFFRQTDEYVGSQKPVAGQKWNTLTYTSTTMFLLVLPHFSMYPAFFYIGQPWKQKIYGNILLVTLMALNAVASVVIHFATQQASDQLNLLTIPWQSASVLLLISVGSLLLGYLFNIVMTQIILRIEDSQHEQNLSL